MLNHHFQKFISEIDMLVLKVISRITVIAICES
ncbi:hypothetical protein CGSSa00_00181 [Staphylococcus aureus subsp. aureus CGS00]|nr:hypothetical protein CGSSa00_00181 [Staphylococcus aureus subsp. aureus CGS00]